VPAQCANLSVQSLWGGTACEQPIAKMTGLHTQANQGIAIPFPARATYSCLAQEVQTASGNQPPIQSVQGPLPPRVKWPGPEAHQSN